MERFNIIDGDATTSNGTAIATRDTESYMGRRLVVLTDPVDCPACGTTGYVAPDGLRYSSSLMGLIPALNGDLCMCECETKPRLVNSLICMRELFS